MPMPTPVPIHSTTCAYTYARQVPKANACMVHSSRVPVPVASQDWAPGARLRQLAFLIGMFIAPAARMHLRKLRGAVHDPECLGSDDVYKQDAVMAWGLACARTRSPKCCLFTPSSTAPHRTRTRTRTRSRLVPRPNPTCHSTRTDSIRLVAPPALPPLPTCLPQEGWPGASATSQSQRHLV